MKKEYTKTFNFGSVAYTGKAKKNRVSLEVTLEIKDEKATFSASGNVWNTRGTNIEMGGQCIDDIYSQFKDEIENRKLYEAIMGLWERNHLNDMHPDCVHQRKAKLSAKVLSISELKLDYKKAGSQQRDIEKRVIEDVKEIGRAEITKEEQTLLNMPYFLTIPAEDIEKYPLYEVTETKQKTAGWVSPEEHPEGQLGKPCEVCGYKYGTAWVYEPIEKGDLAEIMNILSVPLSERNSIIKLGK